MFVDRSACLLLFLPLFAVAAACASDDAASADEEPEPTDPGSTPRRVGGPLANAGPDRQVLEGQMVRLDAGSTLPGETGREPRYLWTVAPSSGGAVPLAIDDPTARRIRLVTPVLAEGQERAEVRLRLRVDDGYDRSEDEVRLEVVRGLATAVAPVGSAGPDIMVVAGEAATIGPRPGDGAIVDPACTGGDCPPPIVTWTQVEGPAAALFPIAAPTEEDGCVAPCARVETDEALAEDAGSLVVAAVLSFRVDVISGTTGLAAAPDFVRVFVSPRYRETAPAVTLTPAGPWFVGTTEAQQVWGGAREPLGFRPILGEAAPVPGEYGYRFVHPAPDSPSLLGWAFEGRQGRLRSAPQFLLVDWRDLPAPVADAGPDPVQLVDDVPRQPDGCDRVRLVGTGQLSRTDPTTGASCALGRDDPSLEYCWRQTHGPTDLAGVPDSCGARSDWFESGSRLPDCDSDLACPDLVIPAPAGETGRLLAFELRVRQRAAVDAPTPAWSAPDTVVVRAGSGSHDDPPVAQVAFSRPSGNGSLVPLVGPADEGETVVLDASGSFDPEGLPLSFSVEGLGDEPLLFTPHTPCPSAGACFVTVVPAVVAPSAFPFALAVSDGETTTMCGGAGGGGVCLDRQGNRIDAPALSVDDTINEAPVVVAESELSAAPGSLVTLDASGSRDPNGDPLAFAWSAPNGDVVLDGANTATPSFVAPAAPAEVMLALRVNDNRGGEANATVRIHVTEPPRSPKGRAIQ